MSLREEHHGGQEGPVTLDVGLYAGSVVVREGDGPGVTVRIEGDPSASWWVAGAGLAGVLGRVEEHLTGVSVEPDERGARAVEATAVTWDPEAGELRVTAPDDRSLRSVPLTVVLEASEVGVLRVRAGAADVRAETPVGEVDVEGTGAVELAETRGRASVRGGASAVRVGTARASLRVRGGAGDVAVERAFGPVEVVAGAGRVQLGEVHADVAVRLAGGEIEVAEAAGGDLDLSTGAGSVRVGLRAGIDARLDLHTLAGSARSELPVLAHRPAADGPGSRAEPVRLRARSTAGDVVVALRAM